jgi:hypothetical protein
MDEPALSEAVKSDLPSPKPNRRRRNLIVLSLAGILVLSCATWVATYFRALSQAKQESRRTSECYDHLQLLGMAFQHYVLDHDGKLPKAESWCDDLLPYLKVAGVLRCPADSSRARSSYAMNADMSGKNVEEVCRSGTNTVLLFEAARPGSNPSGSRLELVSSGRHYRSINSNPVIGIRLSTVADLGQGTHYLFVGGLQPVYVLQSSSTADYLPKGVLSGRNISQFKW